MRQHFHIRVLDEMVILLYELADFTDERLGGKKTKDNHLHYISVVKESKKIKVEDKTV